MEPLSVTDADAGTAARARTGDPVAELAREHGYPAEVEDILRQAVAILAPLRPVGVLLHGSAARGELTWWREAGGRLRLGSDVEMYVACEGAVAPEGRERATAALDALAAAVNEGGPPLFHVDVGFTTRDGMARHAPTFRCWDTRATGRVLAGADLRTDLPDLVASDIDLRQLNEVPIHRLWEMAFRVPARLVRGEPAGDRAFACVCARQALDLTTWLLPHAGVLVPTFAARNRVWRERFAELPVAGYFPASSAELLDECLETKLRFEPRRGGAELHGDVLDAFRAGLRMVLATGPTASDEEIAAAARASGALHWQRETPRRRAYEAYLLLRARPAPLRGIRWLVAQKRVEQVVALLHLNAALSALLAGGDASAPLSRTEAALGRLWFGFSPRPGAPAERWLAARRGYVEYLVGSSRWFGPRRDYLFSVIEP